MRQDIRWYNAQLHNHTTHSDGKFRVPEMIDRLAERGAEVLALTDHNAASGNEEFLRHCAEKGLIGIRGNEVSTYYGHVVGLGVEDYVDWRYFRPEEPEAIFREIHARGGLCGYAHPIRIGYPLVPGCNWMFHINDYTQIDYYEILNTGDYLRSRNDLVIEEWVTRLREGLTWMGAVSGLDYHGRPWHGHEYVTYLALPREMEDGEKAAFEAVRRQRMIVCKDALVAMELEDGSGGAAIPGEEISPFGARLRVCAEPGVLPERPVWLLDDQAGQRPVVPGEPFDFDTFAVIRLYDGTADFDHLVAISNPFHALKAD